jgi:hypothetical protein
MATKDWKKLRVIPDSHMVVYYRNTKTDESLHITEVRWQSSFYVSVSSSYWTDSKFKTKSEALKFAKEYMRKH